MQIRAALLASLALLPPVAWAQPAELTPVGAEKSGNASGTIPAWNGGLAKAPADHKPGDHYADPYPDDKVLFTIDAGNAAQYVDHLSPGQIALLQKYPTWKMPVYTTRRSAAYPEKVYEETIANRGKASLAPDGDGLTGVTGGVPFPAPVNGLQVIWNHLTRYRGDMLKMEWDQAAVLKGNAPNVVGRENEFLFGYGNLSAPRDNDVLFYFWQKSTAPAKINGNILLLHEHLADAAAGRSAWAYVKSLNRIIRAPAVGYESPDPESNGTRVNDELLMFNGATDRFDWKLQGKRELYVPYNAYRLAAARKGYDEILAAGHLNPALLRYELHRAWVVEATLKSGKDHIYGRRVFYVDEDSWSVLVIDKYDRTGKLVRVAEMHPVEFYDIPMPFAAAEVHHDLDGGHYIASGLQSDKARVYERVKRTAGDFKPEMQSMVR